MRGDDYGSQLILLGIILALISVIGFMLCRRDKTNEIRTFSNRRISLDPQDRPTMMHEDRQSPLLRSMTGSKHEDDR